MQKKKTPSEVYDTSRVTIVNNAVANENNMSDTIIWAFTIAANHKWVKCDFPVVFISELQE